MQLDAVASPRRPARQGRVEAKHGVTAVVLVVALGSVAAGAQSPDPATMPTYVDTVERGLRLRLDAFGRYNTVGLPDPPVRLEVDEVVDDQDDFDVGGVVLLGWDRPFGVPIVGDFMGDLGADVGGDSPVSPFLDDQSVAPRARIYSAFIGISGAPGEALEIVKLNLGRMTEIVESPITYDGLSGGINMTIPKLGWLNAKLWGGIDAPQRLAADPFTRTDPKAYEEAYVDDSGFVSPTGGLYIQRSFVDANDDGINPQQQFNPVGGLLAEGRFAGVGFHLSHTLLPTLQRSRLGASYAGDFDVVAFHAGADLRASDFLPRQTNVYGDVLTGDGTTRVGAKLTLQFLEDICTYDCTFRAFDPANVINQVNDQGQVITNDQVETFRVRDQIRHLNIGPRKEHFAAFLDAERQLPLGFTALGHFRMRQHFDAADLDYFRSDIYEGGVGLMWSTGLALDLGVEAIAGTLNSGLQDGVAYDQLAEGVSSYVENRAWVRTVLLEGKLANLAEIFVRRQDIQTKAILASGQWSAAFASTLRYDIFDMWSMSLRLEGDALAPVDTLNGSSYLGALVGTSVRF